MIPKSTMFITFIMSVGCSQRVHVKTTRYVPKAIIDTTVVEDLNINGKDVVIPVGFGAAAYELFDHEARVGKGFIERSHINPWTFGLSVGGAAVLAPTLALAAVVAVNPAWIFAPSVFLDGKGVGSFLAYLSQAASIWTVPAAALGAAIGLLPLIGLFFSERLPDVVTLDVHNGIKVTW